MARCLGHGKLEQCGSRPPHRVLSVIAVVCGTRQADKVARTDLRWGERRFLQAPASYRRRLTARCPVPQLPGLVPGDRWCVTAANWLRAHHDGAAAHVVLASTHERALDIVPLAALKEHAVDVPANPGALED